MPSNHPRHPLFLLPSKTNEKIFLRSRYHLPLFCGHGAVFIGALSEVWGVGGGEVSKCTEMKAQAREGSCLGKLAL